jgi:asparagine synthase (glutamine-hydrolysing)
MCGIAGLCHLKGDGAVPIGMLRAMIAIQRHRGPDETGFYLDDRVGLGQARLSIIDLRDGSQPIHNEDETLWIVFNGEIFNYPELREELLRLGHRFYTKSDTEVIVHVYEQWGPDGLSRMNGQFAFAIWDTRAKSLFLARDRVGIRPLHYAVRDDALLFSSEIKGLFATGRVPRELDPVGLDQVFTFWTHLPGRTAFRHVQELPPGHFMTVAGGRVEIRRFWDYPFAPDADCCPEPPEALAEQARDLLVDAIRVRLRADVPVGAYLSGGLDSSGITALVVKHFDNRVNTFGIRFEEGRYDEGDHQSLMVRELGARHTESLATNERIGEAFADVIWHCETPLLRTAPTPLFLLSRCVHEHNLKVVLTGEGADEVFGGYNIFREAKIRRFWSRQPNSQARAALVERLYPYIFNNPRLRYTLRAFFAKGLDRPDDPFFSHHVRWQTTSQLKNLFAPALREAIGAYSGLEELRPMLPAAFDSWDTLSKAQYLEMMLLGIPFTLVSGGASLLA